MVHPVDALVEFEISIGMCGGVCVEVCITLSSVTDYACVDKRLPLTSSTHTHPIYLGNYGNKLDMNNSAQSSTTPPTNPTYDGIMYYFLPWMDKKPCCVVDSQWEDCTYRIESLNIILFTADHLVQREGEEGRRERREGGSEGVQEGGREGEGRVG